MKEAKKTALYDSHVAAGGKMVEFGGFLMPVQYRGIIEEHLKVRKSVGVFDVSHMGEFEIRGSDALEFLQRVTTNDVSKLQIGQAQYTVMCYPEGGIVDDLIVYRFADHYMMVVNASNIDKDWQWVQQQSSSNVELQNKSEDISLFAVQGRNAHAALQKIVKSNVGEIQYYWFAESEIAGVPAVVSRTGYTGEDGFEVGIPVEHAEKVWQAILEAGREFEIFIGKEVVARTKAGGPQRKLVGFEVQGRQIARHGYAITKDEDTIGHVTSGSFSPSLQKSIGMGYVTTEYSSEGSEISIDVRGRPAKARVVKGPFYKRPY